MESPEIQQLVGGGSHLLRDDLGVPLMVINSESETRPLDRFSSLIRSLQRREVSGSAHGSPDTLRDLSKHLA